MQSVCSSPFSHLPGIQFLTVTEFTVVNTPLTSSVTYHQLLSSTLYFNIVYPHSGLLTLLLSNNVLCSLSFLYSCVHWNKTITNLMRSFLSTRRQQPTLLLLPSKQWAILSNFGVLLPPSTKDYLHAYTSITTLPRGMWRLQNNRYQNKTKEFHQCDHFVIT